MPAVSNKMEMQCSTTNYSYWTPPPGKVTLDVLNTSQLVTGSIYVAKIRWKTVLVEVHRILGNIKTGNFAKTILYMYYEKSIE